MTTIKLSRKVIELAKSLSNADAWLGDEFDRNAELFQHMMSSTSLSFEERVAVFAGTWRGVNNWYPTPASTAYHANPRNIPPMICFLRKFKNNIIEMLEGPGAELYEYLGSELFGDTSGLVSVPDSQVSVVQSN